MRGEIFHYDDSQGFGFITGEDGKQYTCGREDFRQPMVKTKGVAVEFQASGSQAKFVRAPQPPAGAAAMPPATATTHARPAEEPTLLDPVPVDNLSPPQTPTPAAAPVPPSPPATQARAAPAPPPVTLPAGAPPSVNPYPPPYDPSGGTDIWSYFWRGMTANYVNFSGRARRKEYWGFVLFSSLAFVALLFIGLAIDLSSNSFSWNDPTIIFTWALPCLWILATILPGISITVRRQHDIGISGWFYLLVFIPSVGGLIILVFSLIPSQRHDNKWGPVPHGVLWTPYYAPPAAA